MAERAKWAHHDGDMYMPIFGDWFGNERDGFERRWSRLTPTSFASLLEAKKRGLRAQDSDDFNIAVVRRNRVTALLWMDEDMAEEQDVLDQITQELLGG